MGRLTEQGEAIAAGALQNTDGVLTDAPAGDTVQSGARGDSPDVETEVPGTGDAEPSPVPDEPVIETADDPAVEGRETR